MPELASRKKWERELRRAFRAIGRERVNELIELLGDLPNPDNVPASFWRRLGIGLREQFEPALEAIYLDAAKQMVDEAPIEVNWLIAKESAATWAKQYSFALVQRINATTRQRLQDIFAGFFRQRGTTVGDLRRLIAPEVNDLRVKMRDGSIRLLTSAERARLIATTEVTRAAVAGEKRIIQEVESAGIEMVAIWETQRDDKVCPICRPRQGRARGDGWRDDPPAHPGCYCDLRYEPRQMRS